MTVAVLLGVLAAALAALALAVAWRRRGAAGGAPAAAGSGRRILFPFDGEALSEAALDSALRIARAEGATLVPAYLACVPMKLPLSTSLPYACDAALPLLEAIEQRATAAGVPVDGRIERGRTNRHAVRELMEHERFDRLVVAAETASTDGFSAADVAWLLENVPGEIVILRPVREAALGGPDAQPGSAKPAAASAARPAGPASASSQAAAAPGRRLPTTAQATQLVVTAAAAGSSRPRSAPPAARTSVA